MLLITSCNKFGSMILGKPPWIVCGIICCISSRATLSSPTRSMYPLHPNIKYTKNSVLHRLPVYIALSTPLFLTSKMTKRVLLSYFHSTIILLSQWRKESITNPDTLQMCGTNGRNYLVLVIVMTRTKRQEWRVRVHHNL